LFEIPALCQSGEEWFVLNFLASFFVSKTKNEVGAWGAKPHYISLPPLSIKDFAPMAPDGRLKT